MVETVTQTPFGTESNPSYNGYELQLNPKLSPTEKKIIAVLRKASIPISPEEIRTKIAMLYDQKEIPQGTIRPLLRNLTKRAIIHNPYKGLYCDKLTYDVAVKPIAVHNLRLHCEVGFKLEHWEFSGEFGGAVVFVCFGERRGLVSGWVKYDRGLSRPACMLAIDKWVEVAEKRLCELQPGFRLTDFWLTRLEVNRDEAGVCFDSSLHCATRDVLKDFIVERVYEKEDCLRQEYCVRKDMTAKDLDNLFTRGIDSFLASAAGCEQDRKLSGLEKVAKNINLKLLDLDGGQRAIQQKLIAGAVGEDSAWRILAELKEDNRRTLVSMASRHREAMDLLISKSVENEELKRLVLQTTRSVEKLVEVLKGVGGSEGVSGNQKIDGDRQNYVR